MLSLKIRDKKTDLELGSLVLRIKKLCENNCFDIRKEQFTLQHSAPDCYIILSLKLKVRILILIKQNLFYFIIFRFWSYLQIIIPKLVLVMTKRWLIVTKASYTLLFWYTVYCLVYWFTFNVWKIFRFIICLMTIFQVFYKNFRLCD